MATWRLFALAVAGLFTATALADDDSNGVPKSLLDKLTVGVNITRWFCYVGDPNDTGHFTQYMKADDFANFTRLGLGFVRLCISPEVSYNASTGFNKKNQPFIDSGVRRLVDNDLVVLYDLHDNGQMKLDQTFVHNDAFVRYWEATARHFKGENEDRLVFELLNEPQYLKNPDEWYSLQERTVKAIRAIDPQRTIVATGTGWGGIDTLAKMKPLEETNIIYSYHCYDPFFFTHQGATWAGEQVKHLKSMPFPSSPDAVAAMIDQIEPSYRGLVKSYGDQHFDEAYLKSRLNLAEGWGHDQHVPVFLGEFGAYPPVAPEESRGRWFDAMKSVQRELHVRSCLWGYDDSFGLGRKALPDNSVELDRLVLKHLFGL